MKTLNRTHLQSAQPLPAGIACGPLAAFPERIVQFGEGNFLRAFADWMIDELNGCGLLQSSVLVVQPIRQGLADLLNAQDGLYSVLSRGMQNGQVVESRRVITAVRRALNPYDQWDQLVAAFRGPDLRFILSNTTEAGIAYVAEARVPGVCPESFPAKVAALLFERFQATEGRAESGLVFLPCELIEANGTALRRAVFQHAVAWELPAAFVTWVEKSNYFLNTLVDRIVPGYPKAESAALNAQLGLEDKLTVAAESFHLWVIEGPEHLAAELPFAQAGLNVIWTDDLRPYRNRKVRVLNGAHTSTVLAAHAAGFDTVLDMMRDPTVGAFLRRALFEEILPHVSQPAKEREAYAAAVLERFNNPFIRHELLSISLNSVSKWKVRVLISLLDEHRTTGQLPPLLTFSLAALLWFYRAEKMPDGSYQGLRDGQRYPVRDDAPVLEFFAQTWAAAQAAGDVGQVACAALGRVDFWGQNLNALPGLTDAVASLLAQIDEQGMKQALTSALDNQSVASR
jgi:tagaturonate reductase